MNDAWHGTELAWIGLGSNLESPHTQVSTALEELAGIPATCVLAHSGLYRSDPVGPPGQPDYINAVALLRTQLEPHSLLDSLQGIEQLHQRRRIQHWGPRTLDLDLLLYGQQQISTDRLQVPHPYMSQRSFVLYPLAEISPGLILPGLGALFDLLAQCPMGTLNRIPV
ncbi:2-amino-4-hydroxy-6-hydroxymethyldihydropteridine diphosphokinase [Pokkaliibacter plantistimulans]|uniref:2-amino-4-hydroxy-6-hydroxymethyldihydropteridine pyrophosphokinase n=1 Tax=Proteobacteria bacterium 228 TaxID=2083153 RepID=A0A2S5KWL5_9PROT|nr:2-amino-4-hydroxy-6-hydroxymethyldihydropteridine diphosphokinase [Pokkaliibacter plantistimulans]PPC79113.1 2-amino-4-hydroxy-6-hydroxymethyldihydropteridine diphosphokinase [Pokkaliibacter plantistimulans]